MLSSFALACARQSCAPRARQRFMWMRQLFCVCVESCAWHVSATEINNAKTEHHFILEIPSRLCVQRSGNRHLIPWIFLPLLYGIPLPFKASRVGFLEAVDLRLIRSYGFLLGLLLLLRILLLLRPDPSHAACSCADCRPLPGIARDGSYRNPHQRAFCRTFDSLMPRSVH